MVRGSLASLLFSLILTYEVLSLELLANHKYWKSTSDQLTYDYSGNSRHGSIFSDYIVTDRGLSPYNFLFASCMSYRYPDLNDYTFSFWMFNNLSPGQFYFNIYNDAVIVGIYYVINTNSTELRFYLYANGAWTHFETTYSPSFKGWNLHTLNLKIDSAIQDRIYFNIFLNLSPLHSTFMDTGINILFRVIHFSVEENDPSIGLILYELWIHASFYSISELNTLLYSSSSCGCANNCPTSPITVCLPLYGRAKNKLGQTCPSICTSVDQSCDFNLNCIAIRNSGCQYGLYDLESSECLFYCPHNSCSCPSAITNTFQTLSKFNCSCIVGFNKVSDDPPACVSVHCLTYHIVGYKYICSNTESGYTLDSKGDCCVCDPNYTQVSTSPLICINTSICIGHSLSVGDYSCSSCATGYKIDSQEKCNLCDTDYVVVQSNPLICALKIASCSTYIYSGTSWECERCNIGYNIDSNGLCNQCELGYFVSSSSPFTCTKEIFGCVDYIEDVNSWVCGSCNDGLYLSNSRLECIARNCLAFAQVDDNNTCLECSIGYEIDADGYCNLCEDNFYMILEEPFTCVPKIENCSSYKVINEELICEKCNIGYKLGETGLCDECEANYSRVESELVLCKPDILNCLVYEAYQEGLKCAKCEYGYIIDANYQCSVCEVGYIKLHQDNSICTREIYNCSEYLFHQNSWICGKCELGYKLDDELRCNQCASGYKYSNNTILECISEADSSNQELDSGANSSDSEVEETISIAQKQRVEVIESYNNLANTIGITSISVSSVVSMNSNTLILYINTIQTISMIQYLNINLPLEIKKQQSSSSEYMKSINFLSFIMIQNTNVSDYIKSSFNDDHSFISQAIYQIIVLMVILALNSIIYCMKRWAIGSKLLGYFNYTIYIQFFTITYLDITYLAIEKLRNVRFYLAYRQHNT